MWFCPCRLDFFRHLKIEKGPKWPLGTQLFVGFNESFCLGRRRPPVFDRKKFLVSKLHFCWVEPQNYLGGCFSLTWWWATQGESHHATQLWFPSRGGDSPGPIWVYGSSETKPKLIRENAPKRSFFRHFLAFFPCGSKLRCGINTSAVRDKNSHKTAHLDASWEVIHDNFRL